MILLESIYNRTYINPEISEEIEEVLLVQQIRHKIPGYVGRKKKIANKTGDESAVLTEPLQFLQKFQG